MTSRIETEHREVKVDMRRPLPISIRLRHGEQNPVAWYAPYPRFTPVMMDGFIGAVAQGGSVNTNDITFNPHGNGTHTECIGHLTKEAHTLDEYMREHLHLAYLHTVDLTTLAVDESEYRKSGDRIINLDSVKQLDLSPDINALIIRTLPNSREKLSKVYTGNNPPYVDPAVTEWVKDQGVEHLLIDLPSVDRESDGGLMLAHRAFWYDRGTPRMHATITEMVYVPDAIQDGEYLLNIMVAPFGNDASPSKPILYPIIP